ncbi:MAG TPA: DUF6350 family protein, partial [Actinomycetospora sp.]|nr:DUF6350 family protein [Actinomycetospora sp.]
ADVAPEAGSGAGLALLCVAYLPNAVVAAVGWLLGPGVSVGLASATPTGITSGLLPPVPLAALLPQSPPPTWAGLAFAVPLAVGSAVGWRLAPTAPDAATRVRATATAAVGAAALLGLAAALSGGRLGAGPFDPVTIPAAPVALAAMGWVLVPGLVVALLAVPLGEPGSTPGAPAAPLLPPGPRSIPVTTPTTRSPAPTPATTGPPRTGPTPGTPRSPGGPVADGHARALRRPAQQAPNLVRTSAAAQEQR